MLYDSSSKEAHKWHVPHAAAQPAEFSRVHWIEPQRESVVGRCRCAVQRQEQRRSQCRVFEDAQAWLELEDTTVQSTARTGGKRLSGGDSQVRGYVQETDLLCHHMEACRRDGQHDTDPADEDCTQPMEKIIGPELIPIDTFQVLIRYLWRRLNHVSGPESIPEMACFGVLQVLNRYPLLDIYQRPLGLLDSTHQTFNR